MAGMKDVAPTFLAITAILVGIILSAMFFTSAAGNPSALVVLAVGVVLVAAGATRLWIKSSFYRG